MRREVVLVVMVMMLVAAGCAAPGPSADQAATPTTAAAPTLGIRPAGDTEIQPDLSQVPPDLQKVYAHIDEN
ncbi:MAG: hypothetical protein ACT4QD_12465, partial [Acidobacteriota bacterium]